MAVGILVLPILILIALALGVLVYYICYKVAINRKLRAEESGAHVPMASMESVWKVVAVIAVFVMYCSLNSKIVDLQEELTEARMTLTDEIAALQYEVYELQEAAKKEASLFSEIFYDFGEIDTKNHTVEMSFWVVPKSYSEETEVSVIFRGETMELVNDKGRTFSGSKSFPIFEEIYEEGMICVTESGVTKTEVWEDAPQGSFSYKCLPQICMTDSSIVSQRGKDSVRIEGEINIVSSKKNGSAFRELALYVKKGDAVIDEIAMDDGHASLDREYPAKGGERISLYVKGTDEYGYIHEEYVGGWNGESAAGVGYEVTAPYGNRVYAPDGSVPVQ